MTLYSTLTVNLSNSQLKKLKSGKKNGSSITLKLSSNVVGDPNDENNFSHKVTSSSLEDVNTHEKLRF